MKKGDTKDFENSGDLLEFMKTWKAKDGQFALQCGRGKDGFGYRIIKI